jgi:hypothetical protein
MRKKVVVVRRRGRGPRAVTASGESEPQAPPKPKSEPLPVELQFTLAPAMLALKGLSLPALIRALGVCLFKPGLTLQRGATRWCDGDEEPDWLHRTRRDVVHALLGISSAAFFSNDQIKRPDFALPLTDLPLASFAESLASAISLHVRGGGTNEILADFVRNGIAFATRLFTVQEFREAIAGISADLFLCAYVGESAFLAGESAFGVEAVSLLYMVVMSQPGFLTAIESEANCVFTKLFSFAQVIYARRGFCYVHSIVIAIVLMMVADQKIASQLSEPSGDPAVGSYGDFVLNGIMNICESPEFWPSFAVIFHMIAPYVTAFSRATADRVMGVVETIWTKERLLVPLFLDSFASILKKTETADNHFLGAFVHKGDFLDEIDLEDSKSAKALPLLKDFLVIVDEVMEEDDIDELTDEELVELLEELEFDEDEAPGPTKAPHAFEGEMERTWGEWSDLLFIRCFKPEVQKMQSFQVEYTPVLKLHLAQVINLS